MGNEPIIPNSSWPVGNRVGSFRNFVDLLYPNLERKFIFTHFHLVGFQNSLFLIPDHFVIVQVDSSYISHPITL